MSGIFVGSKAMFQRMLKAMEKAKLKPVIHKTFDWKEVPQALEYMKKGNHFGKLCLRKD
jgi:D-arabinose 1-dehydrogenase-like Zn-dependent alcohol dehydrogenase